MRLSWNEIRARASTFAAEWAGQGYEKGQTQLFYRDLFEVFGIPVRRVASFEEPVKLLEKRWGFIDLLWKGVLLVEQKSAGRPLITAKRQALDYFPGLGEDELPRYVLVSDFQTFELYDLDEGEEFKFSLAELPQNVEKLGFIVGLQKRSLANQEPVSIRAAKLIGGLYGALSNSGYVGEDLERFLVRIVFCLFADDTGIFEQRDMFLDLLESRTRPDGSDLGGWLEQLFQVLSKPEGKRPTTLDEDLARFPYINGSLFEGRLEIPSFDSEMREHLIQACRFDWSSVSPSVFGALLQAVFKTSTRSLEGAHYTTEENVLKVIRPLFLDELALEFEALKASRRADRRYRLGEFHKKLASLKFLDPSCGAGSFLVVTYRELRRLEVQVLRELAKYGEGSNGSFPATPEPKVNVDQFYGIEKDAFAARVTEAALWMMDHLMNNQVSLEFGRVYSRIPLATSPHITTGDALELPWTEVLPVTSCSYVFGNPPFLGAKKQTPTQRTAVRRIVGLGKKGGTLDLVAAWFVLAAAYVQGTGVKVGFVATSSISQGEQIGQLWPVLFEKYGMEIIFAHQTFVWGSDLKGKPHVHVIVIGMTHGKNEAPSALFSYRRSDETPTVTKCTWISPYLVDGGKLKDPHLVLKSSSTPLNGLPKLRTGSKPIDNRHYIFSRDERDAFLQAEPRAEPFMRPFVGTEEFLDGRQRYILYLAKIAPATLKSLPHVLKQVEHVKRFREGSRSPSTRDLPPTLFHLKVIPDSPFLVIPEVSSERREYVPIGWLEPPTIPSNLVKVLLNATLAQFAILTSAMHMSWLRSIGGRLENRYRYSIKIVYNLFPMPTCRAEDLKALEPFALKVLEQRAAATGATLADLYDENSMPPGLRKAHRDLDTKVDRLYRQEPFSSQDERAAFLLRTYESTIAPSRNKTQRRRRAT